MKFYGIKKVTLIDFPENIACTLFTHGCNFRCPFCHNPELVIEKPNSKEELIDAEIIEFLHKRKNKLDGIVITGGEPLIHKQNLQDFIEVVKNIGLKIKIDTNGTNPDHLEKLINNNLIDYVAMDYKCSPEKYYIMGAKKGSFTKVEKTMEILKNSGINYEIRTTVVPGIHNIEEINNMGEYLKGISKYVIQNFVPHGLIDPDYNKKKSFEIETLKEFQKAAQKFVRKVEIIENY
ncbi:anaerobic ribonucleoside-triphosphate reductase activating protein [Candidatus Dojkabacteria bacterium]|nr:anaerobic ribonucleoside-triphosphate reductase activating protein [Candidatus Dojkabacteria bacterium]